MPTNAVRFDRGSPKIVVLNESEIPDRELRRVVRAIQKQVDEDFFPLWGWRAKLVYKPAKVPKRTMQIIVMGQDDDDELGYHFIEGVPVAHVFTIDGDGKPIANYSVTLSHEVLEMIADPGVNLYALGHYFAKDRPKKREAFVALEVCDPVQETVYDKDGVSVSDFVVPEWFEPERKRGSMSFSFMEAVDAPFRLAPGGYIDVQVGKRLITVDRALARAKKHKKRRHRHAERTKRTESEGRRRGGARHPG